MDGDGAYRERPSATPGVTVWTRTATGEDGWVLPDGCLDVLWFGDRLWVAGPDTGPAPTDSVAGRRYAAVRFASGVGPAVLGVPADAVRDERVELECVLDPDEVDRLATRLRADPDPSTVLDRWATARLREGPGPDPTMLAVAGLLEQGVPVASVAEEVGVSDRQLLRRSLAAFGYGPKVLARIQRLQRALALARRGTDLARTAAEAGYFDQAHLAREVRALAGQPITRLLAAS